MTVLFAVIVLITSTLFGCTQVQQQEANPPMPSKIWGWKYHEEKGLKIQGDFVLKIGDSTDNGKIRVKVVEVNPSDVLAEPGTIRYQPRVILQFMNLSDNKVLCEDVFPEKGSISLRATKCGSQLSKQGILSIYVDAINFKDGWVHFQFFT